MVKWDRGIPAGHQYAQEVIVQTADIDAAMASPLASQMPPSAALSLCQYIYRVRDNAIAGFHKEMFDKPIVETRYWKLHTFMVSDPAGIKHVMVDNASNYLKGGVEQRISGTSMNRNSEITEERMWSHRREVISQSFDHGSMIEDSATILDAAQRMLATWRSLPPGAIIEVSTEMRAMTLEVISKIVFSADWMPLAHRMGIASRRYQKERTVYLLDFIPVLDRLWRIYEQYRRQRNFESLNSAVDRLIIARAQPDSPSYNDFLAQLIRDNDPLNDKSFCAEKLHRLIPGVLGAGFETVALTLMWTWYLLSQHPLQEAKLHAELNRVLAGRRPELNDLAKLIYTRSVIEEALRLYPPFHTLAWRMALEDDEVSGVRIPKGSTITIAPWVLHRHTKLWDDPERFDPERFSPDRSRGRSSFAYLPFGLGPRVCVGARFAITETMLIVATVAQSYRLRLVPGHRVEPRGLILLQARNGLKMTLESRQ